MSAFSGLCVFTFSEVFRLRAFTFSVTHSLIVRTAHTVCGAGEWIATAGTATSDTKCQPCPKGTFRAKAPTGRKAEKEADVCIVHQPCKAGEWTEAEGTAKTDTKCTACGTGLFRATAPTGKVKETRNTVCIVHQTCKAGEWTSAIGSSVRDTTCTGCPSGTARAQAPSGSTAVERVSISCTACVDKSLYSDEVGLTQCKTCPNGHYGVTVPGSDAEGGHKACDDDTCERPTSLPANSVVGAGAKCPEHGKQKRMRGTVTSQAASTCALSCKEGYYSITVSTPFTCLADDKATTASYQGGKITCAGESVGVGF